VTAGETRPRRRKTGILLSLATFVVIVLAAVGIAGFAYPGWFLPGDGSRSTPAGVTPSASGDHGLTAAGTATSVVHALNSGDIPGFRALTCAKQRARVEKTVQAYDPRLTASSGKGIENVQVDYAVRTVRRDHENHAVADISENFSDLPRSYRKLIPENRFDGRFTLIRSANRWQLCGVAFTIPGAPSGPAQPDPPATSNN
jgi:hypothetical protein